MTEAGLVTLLQGICPRVYPILAPSGAAYPYVTWQQTGGMDVVYANGQAADKHLPDVLIKVYSASLKEAAATLKLIDAALRASDTEVESINAYQTDVETEFDPWRYNASRFYELLMDR